MWFAQSRFFFGNFVFCMSDDLMAPNELVQTSELAMADGGHKQGTWFELLPTSQSPHPEK